MFLYLLTATCTQLPMAYKHALREVAITSAMLAAVQQRSQQGEIFLILAFRRKILLDVGDLHVI